MKFQGKDGTLRVYDRGVAGYIEVHFRNLDFSGPIGRAKLDENLILDGGLINEFAHYINGSDMVLYDPTPLSFSFFTDDKCTLETARNTVYQALICRNAQDADLGTWTGFGRSTKGSTKNNGVDFNPVFDTASPNSLRHVGIVDSVATTTMTDNDITFGTGEPCDWIFVFSGGYSGLAVNGGGHDVVFGEDISTLVSAGESYSVYENMRTVDIQFKLTSLTGLDIVWKFAEVYFPPNELAMAESEESVTITASGGCYGTITRGADWM